MTVRVFVSYRRDDSKHAAGRLGERLDERFKLFMDVDQIQGAADFTAEVRKAVDQTDVFLVVIGSQWLTLTAENGRRRIDQPGDWVAEEIGSALRRGTPVIPVLVDGARMPSRDELPPALADLANRQAMRIVHESFAADSARLIQTIESMVSEAKPEDVKLWDDPDYSAAEEKRKRAAELLAGRYELGELLGRGGIAEVRRAVDRRLGRSVAVKQLRTDLATDLTFQARFRREAQSAAGLNHPTIVAVYDTGEEIDPLTGVAIPYIVMELVEGPTLRDVLREGRKILPERAMEVTQGILDALSYSHKAGIVHRDIKPANVMLTPNGGVKVKDFSIARAVADTSATMTQTAAVIGTAQYLSPEQAREETVDARSDLYSAGCVLYELLLGRPPFVGDSPMSVAYQHVREAPTPPSQLDPEITPEIDAVVLKALAKDPADRYQSAREMEADITRLLSGVTTAPAAQTPPLEDATSARADQGKATYERFVPLRLQWALFVGFLVVVVILLLITAIWGVDAFSQMK